MENISYNSYGEIRNLNDYKLLQKIYCKEELSEEEKIFLSSKVKCYCGLIVSRNGIKSHISTSLIHKKRMAVYNLSDYWYVNPEKPYCRIDRNITIDKGRFILDFN